MNTRPSTYFLQETIDRGLAAVEARLDRSQGNRPFFMMELEPEPKLIHDIWDFGDMCGRYVDAFILGRQVTGNLGYADEEKSLRRMLPECDPYLEPFMAGRMLITYVDLFLQDRSEENARRISDLVGVIRSKLTFEGDYAYYFKAPAGWRSIESPIWGSFLPYPTYPIGGIMLALARYTEEVDDPVCEELLRRLCTFVLRESGIFAPDGSFYGHTHSGGILTASAAILRWAIRRGDVGTIQFMSRVLDWTVAHCSSWGWVPDGLGSPDPSGETCSLTDALHLLLLHARHVRPSDYGVIERFARNQLLENQFRRPDLAIPPGDFPQREAVERAFVGSWASWSLPNSLDNGIHDIEGCCLGAGIRGCFLVWEGIIEREDDAVRVNMLLSRNSPWAEVIGYQPYAGRVDVIMHIPGRLRVRIPEWVAPDDLAVTLGGDPVGFSMSSDRYAEIDGLREDDRVSIEFPLVERVETEIVSGMTYTVRRRGDTVVGIDPRGERYPLYDRPWAENPDPPVVSRPPYLDQKGGPVRW